MNTVGGNHQIGFTTLTIIQLQDDTIFPLQNLGHSDTLMVGTIINTLTQLLNQRPRRLKRKVVSVWGS